MSKRRLTSQSSTPLPLKPPELADLMADYPYLSPGMFESLLNVSGTVKQLDALRTTYVFTFDHDMYVDEWCDTLANVLNLANQARMLQGVSSGVLVSITIMPED